MPARKEISGIRRLLHNLRKLIVQDKVARGQDLQQLRDRELPLREQRLQGRHSAGYKLKGSGAGQLRSLPATFLMIYLITISILLHSYWK